MDFAPVPDIKPDIPQLHVSAGERYHGFISHCTGDSKVSLHLLEHLEKMGFTCFHSTRDCQPGATTVEIIVKGIKESRRVITIISKNLVDSHWVVFEIANSRAKECETQEVTFLPVLYNIEPHEVPVHVKEINCLQFDDKLFWNKLVDAICVSAPLSDSIPAGNIAHGLAWSHYYGYLSFVLPSLERRLLESEFAQKGVPVLLKMLVVLPESCKCPKDVGTVDENVAYAGTIDFKLTRAGKKDRPYSNSVYKITDPDTEEEFYTVLEYASPLMIMYEMEQGRITNLNDTEKLRQMILFGDKIKSIVKHQAVFLQYKDHRHKGEPQRLSRILSDAIKEQLRGLRKEVLSTPDCSPIPTSIQTVTSSVASCTVSDNIPDELFCMVPKLPSGFKYHLFISHSDEDQELALHLSAQLANNGYIIFHPEAGQSIFNDEVDCCWKVITVITSSYLSDKRHELESAGYIEKGANAGKRVMIPILHNIDDNQVPLHIKDVCYLKTNDGFFWRKLTQALAEDVSLTATIPITDIADGLAWSYYYGYLGIVIPGLAERIQKSKFADGSIPVLDKLIVLMPKSGYCANNIKDIDSNITFVENISFKYARSGNTERDYSNTVLKLVDPDSGNEYYIVMEYATPIRTMYEMEMERKAGLGSKTMLSEVEQFRTKLKQIMSNPSCSSCENKHLLVSFEDQNSTDPHALSRLVAGHVRRELGITD